MFDESFFVLLATALTAVVLFKPLKASIRGALDDYRRKVSSDLDHAEHLHLEAREFVASLNTKRQDIKKRAKAIVEQANESSKLQYEQALIHFQKASDQKRQLLKDRLARIEAQNALTIKQDIADLVYTKAQIALAASGGNHDILVDELIATIPHVFKAA